MDQIGKCGGVAVLCHESATGERHLHPADAPR
jgi:hypothetical protein